MSNVTKIQEQHTAAPQSIGFDYQFYYFMYLALELKTGEKIGFEVKDDIHIERADGKTILFQSKHTILKNADGSPTNLATLDSDLWKTLSNWTDMIKVDTNFLSNHFFCLVTNKGEGNNRFIDALSLFKVDSGIDKAIEKIKELKDKTDNEELKVYIKNVLSLGRKQTKIFLSNLSIETDIDDILEKVKIKIYESIRNADLVDAVFEDLHSNLSIAKYVDIKDRKQFEISYDDFNRRFGKCFRVAFKDKPLPKRKFPIILPDNLEEQLFIKQLLDIGEIDKSSAKIVDYTTQMLQAINNLSYWTENNLTTPTEMDDFNKNALIVWENEFRAKYRQIEMKIKSGKKIEDLETEIQKLALELVYYLRRENLPVAGDTLGIELSNGHYYALSDKPEIGWHFDWDKKYKTT